MSRIKKGQTSGSIRGQVVRRRHSR